MDFSKLSGLIRRLFRTRLQVKWLMVGFMNAEALQRRRTRVCDVFHSGQGMRCGTKGETSGNRLKVTELLVDCDETRCFSR